MTRHIYLAFATDVSRLSSDPRGIGKWEMLSYSQTRPAVWAMDESEAGPNGDGGRPPANEDGTPVGRNCCIHLRTLDRHAYSHPKIVHTTE